MEYLSAPWRGDYVKAVFRMRGCIFCRALRSSDDGATYILYRGKFNFVILNKFPYNPGHLMIAPYRHTASLERTPKEASDELTELLKLSLRVLKKRYRPQGFNVGLNLGRSAGAGVVHHYHLHVIPRWQGDSNFMPLVGRTRVMVEDLNSVYSQLRPLFDKEKGGSSKKKPR